MHRIVVVAVAAVLSTPCHAQNGPNGDQCEQVRSAIAQYGLQAARKHAMANYGLTLVDLRRVEQECGVGGRVRRARR